MIARVFPRRTAMTPRDGLAFFKEPTIENIADCIKENVTEVHISVTFTWDILRAEDLYYAWQILGVPVEVGGPAFDDRMGDFTPGLYLRDGLVFTSRGCTKDCWFCSVPRCARGTVRELPITDGWNILDDNILGTSEQHFRDVCTMLKRQNHPAVFSGGLEPALLQQWQAELLYDVRPDRLYTAYDTKDDLEPLIEMGRKLRAAGFRPARHNMRYYVLVGYEGDSFENAERSQRRTCRGKRTRKRLASKERRRMCIHPAVCICAAKYYCSSPHIPQDRTAHRALRRNKGMTLRWHTARPAQQEYDLGRTVGHRHGADTADHRPRESGALLRAA